MPAAYNRPDLDQEAAIQVSRLVIREQDLPICGQERLSISTATCSLGRHRVLSMRCLLALTLRTSLVELSSDTNEVSLSTYSKFQKTCLLTKSTNHTEALQLRTGQEMASR